MKKIVIGLFSLSVAFFSTWVFHTFEGYKSGANFGFVHLRVLNSQHELFVGAKAISRSPWGTQAAFETDSQTGDLINSLIERRPLSEVVLILPRDLSPSDFLVLFRLTGPNDSYYQRVSSFEAMTPPEGEESSYYSVDIKGPGSLLFKKYDQTINWQGDIWLILTSLAKVVWLTLILGLLPVVWLLFHQSLKRGSHLGARLRRVLSPVFSQGSLGCSRDIPFCLADTVANVGWGSELFVYERYFHPDESKAWSSALDFPSNYFTNRNFLYGTGVQYFLGAMLAPAKAISVLFFSHDPNLQNDFWRYSTIIAFRILNSVLGALCVYPVFALLARWGNRTAAVSAALLIAVSFYHCMNSSFATLDVPLSFGIILMLYTVDRAAANPQRTALVLVGACMGFVVSTKIIGVLGLIIPLVTGLLIYADNARQLAENGRSLPINTKTEITMGLLGAAFTFLCIFAISTPHVFLAFDSYMASMQINKHIWVDPKAASFGIKLIAWFNSLRDSATLPFVVMFIVGYCLNLTVHRIIPWKINLAITLFGLANVAFWGSPVPPRHTIVLLPLISLYCAVCFSYLWSFPVSSIRLAGRAIGVSIIVFGAWCCVSGYLQRQVDSRTLAATYVDKHTEVGSRIALAAAMTIDNEGKIPYRYYRYPYFDTNKRPLSSVDEPHEYLIVEGKTLEVMISALSSGLMGKDYIWPAEENRYWTGARIPKPERIRLFAEILADSSDYELIRDWKNNAFYKAEFSSPTLLLYRRTDK